MTEFDIVIFGATGFTGRLAALNLTRNSSTNLRIALAGRNEKKLVEIARVCDREPSVIVADSTKPKSINDMVKRTRVVLSFAGPFALYGEPVIAAVARYGRDYLDITGETSFIRLMIERYQQEAARTNARLIPFSGFDSVPADMAVFTTKNFARARGIDVEDFVFYYSVKGGFNGGTLATALTMAQQKSARNLSDANSLIVSSGHQWRRTNVNFIPYYEPVLRRWTAPFLMSSVNEAVVRRSCWLTSSSIPKFSYQERLVVKNQLGFLRAQAASAALVGFGAISRTNAGRNIIERFGPKPGQGPSDKERENGFFRGQLIARGKDRTPKILYTIERQGDPGNEITVALAAISTRLAVENSFVTDKKGFLTPSIAFGEILEHAMGDAGFRCTTEILSPR